jgi:hypothetical protein
MMLHLVADKQTFANYCDNLGDLDSLGAEDVYWLIFIVVSKDLETIPTFLREIKIFKGEKHLWCVIAGIVDYPSDRKRPFQSSVIVVCLGENGQYFGSEGAIELLTRWDRAQSQHQFWVENLVLFPCVRLLPNGQLLGLFGHVWWTRGCLCLVYL